jgi:hypothetical protein
MRTCQKESPRARGHARRLGQHRNWAGHAGDRFVYVVVDRPVRFGDGAYIEVVRPSAQRAVQLTHQLCGLLPCPGSNCQRVNVFQGKKCSGLHCYRRHLESVRRRTLATFLRTAVAISSEDLVSRPARCHWSAQYAGDGSLRDGGMTEGGW